MFRTSRLPLATYIHCQRLLEFAGCEEVDARRVAFVFKDPDGQGEELEFKFDRSDGTLVDARAFVTSEQLLKKKMYHTLRNQEVE